MGCGSRRERSGNARRPAHAKRCCATCASCRRSACTPASMTVAESEKMFRDMAFADAGNARQQAARGTFDPAYLNYTMGKLMIRKLREDWTATRGGRNAWKEFHDQFLRYGGPPIPLVSERHDGGRGRPAAVGTIFEVNSATDSLTVAARKGRVHEGRVVLDGHTIEDAHGRQTHSANCHCFRDVRSTGGAHGRGSNTGNRSLSGELKTLEAFIDRLVPKDENGPGAVECGAADLHRSRPRRSLRRRKGSVSRRARGRRNARAGSTHKAPFADLSPEVRDELLTTMENGTAAGFPTRARSSIACGG